MLRATKAPTIAAFLLLTLAAALFLGPLSGVVLALARDFFPDASQPPLARTGPHALGASGWLRLALFTLAWSTTIGAAATFLAWPVAWFLRGRGLFVRALAFTPLLLPSYLAYHAFGQLRDPSTHLGRAIEHLAQAGWPLLPIFISRAVAFVGLVLWVWPVAAGLLSIGVAAVGQPQLDALRLASPSRFARERFLFSSLRPWVVTACTACTLLLLGSPVPMHLADIPTLGVLAWKAAVLEPGRARAWVIAWPHVLIPIIIGLRTYIRSYNQKITTDNLEIELSAYSNTCYRMYFGLVILVSLVLPFVLHFSFLRRPRSAWFEFWSVSGSALAQSLLLAWAVGSALALVALICWYLASASAPRHAPVRLLLAGAVAFGLFPGVLVGHAWMLTWTTVVEPILPGLRESWIAVFLAHLSRFAWIGVGLAWWLSRSEPRDLHDASVLAGGGSIRGFVRTRLSQRWTALLGVGLAGACLSLHEIEATISLQPPGTTSFAQTMLANLHFARSDELAVGSLVAGLGGTVLALLSGRLIGGGTARSPRQPSETLGEPAP